MCPTPPPPTVCVVSCLLCRSLWASGCAPCFVCVFFCVRFLFFSSRTGRILAGTQESLQLVAGTDEVDLEDRELSIHDFLSEEDFGALMSGCESAFHKANSNQLMKAVTVGAPLWCVWSGLARFQGEFAATACLLARKGFCTARLRTAGTACAAQGITGAACW